MKRILLENGARYQDDARRAAIEWLVRSGGGTVVVDLKRNLMDAFNMRGDSDFKKIEDKMERYGIRLSWRRGRGKHSLPYSGSVVALFASEWIIAEMDSRKLDALFVVGWAQSDFAEWAMIRKPKTLRIEAGEVQLLDLDGDNS